MFNLCFKTSVSSRLVGRDIVNELGRLNGCVKEASIGSWIWNYNHIHQRCHKWVCGAGTLFHECQWALLSFWSRKKRLLHLPSSIVTRNLQSQNIWNSNDDLIYFKGVLVNKNINFFWLYSVNWKKKRVGM